MGSSLEVPLWALSMDSLVRVPLGLRAFRFMWGSGFGAIASKQSITVRT